MAWTIASKIVPRVVTIDGSHSAFEAATLMAEEFVGSAVITSSSKVTGIFTERDLMMRVVGKKRDPDTIKINDVMTKDDQRGGHRESKGYGELLLESYEGTSLPPSVGLRWR
jgi:CBS domain-containing protein